MNKFTSIDIQTSPSLVYYAFKNVYIKIFSSYDWNLDGKSLSKWE